MADLPEVTEAKAAFMKVFDAYKAGEIPLPVAPVHDVKPVSYTKPVCNIFFFPFCLFLKANKMVNSSANIKPGIPNIPITYIIKPTYSPVQCPIVLHIPYNLMK